MSLSDSGTGDAMQQSLVLTQQQQLTVRQLQSLKILACTNQELESLLVQEYLENPLLECTIDKQSELIHNIEHLYEKGTTYAEHYAAWNDEDSDRRNDVRRKEHDTYIRALKGQLDLTRYNDAEWELIDYLIHCLDEKGFFPFTPETVAKSAGCDVRVIERLLSDLKRLEPAGVFSADLGECLTAQLRAQGETDPLLYTVIDRYLPEILGGNLSRITRALQISTAELKEYIRRIGALNPRPFMNIEDDETQYIIPDVLVTRPDGKWQVTLNDSWMGEYRYDNYYLKLMKTTTDPELKQYFREKLARAHMVIDAVESRRNTLLRISEAILERQSEYFLTGAALRPMTLDDIAADIGMHASTVSRAIRGKYIQFRRPVLMKQLFTGKVSGELSADGIRQRIAVLIGREDPAHPLSDEKISALLAEEGLRVPRRTIAKYRIALGIPDSRKRVRP